MGNKSKQTVKLKQAHFLTVKRFQNHYLPVRGHQETPATNEFMANVLNINLVPATSRMDKTIINSSGVNRVEGNEWGREGNHELIIPNSAYQENMPYKLN